MVNVSTITGDTGHLTLRLIPGMGVTDDLELATGSFRGSGEDRRVVTVFLAIPSVSKQFEMRLRFTDPAFETQDLFGHPKQQPDTGTVPPFKEPKQPHTPTIEERSGRR